MKYLRKKQDLKDVNKSGTSTEVALKAEKAFCQYEFMKWLDDFVALRQGKNNLPSRGANMEEDENRERDDTGLFEDEDSSTILSENNKQTKMIWKRELKNLITSRQANKFQKLM